MKAGTSWLGGYLAGHPDVFISPIKELHFWNTRGVKSSDGWENWSRKLLARSAGGYGLAKYKLGQSAEKGLRRLLVKLDNLDGATTGKNKILRQDLRERLAMGGSIEAYLDFFRRRAGNQAVWCEITPAYSMLDHTDFAAMAALEPNVRFVFLMRNPAERYWSQLRFARRVKPLLDPYREFSSRLHKPVFDLRSNYRRTLEELFAAVDPARVHLIFFERLFSQSEVDRLCDFVGVARRPANFAPVAQTPGSESMSEEMRAMAVRHFADVYRYIHNHFAGDIPENWRKDIATYLD